MSGFAEPALYTDLLQHFARYFEAVDTCDLDAIASILDGATMQMRGTEVSGPAIRQLYADVQPAPLEDGRRQTKHHALNLLVDGPDDEGLISATVYYIRLQNGDSGPYVAASGRLTEVVARDGDRFRVVTHRITSDF